MRLLKDVRAAATMGMKDTIVLAEAKSKYEERVKLHNRRADDYKEQLTRTTSKFETMIEARSQAVHAVFDSGALEVDDEGNVALGWYELPEDGHETGPEGGNNTLIGAAGSVTGIGAAIGAPALAWTVAGAVGWASTGTAISSLSGAAAMTSTAALFGGGAVAAGGLGMAAAPFVLTGIGAVAGLPVFLTAGAFAAGKKERNIIASIAENERILQRAEDIMTGEGQRLTALAQESERATHRLIGGVEILQQITRAKQDANWIRRLTNSGAYRAERNKAVTDLWEAIQDAERLIQESKPSANSRKLYLEKPGQVQTVAAIAGTNSSIEITWQVPDDGESEITHYRLWVRKGIRGNLLESEATDTKFRHDKLEPNTTYYYRVAAVNEIGIGKASNKVSRKTPA